MSKINIATAKIVEEINHGNEDHEAILKEK
jgi:hypothetical protein